MTQHLYSYTGNNPTNYVDPTGHEGDYVSGMPSGVYNGLNQAIDDYWNSEEAGKDFGKDVEMLIREAQLNGGKIDHCGIILGANTR